MANRKLTAPRIGEQAAKFYPSVFSSLNAGMEYTADAFPVLYRKTLHDLRGMFSDGELSLIIDVFNGLILTPGRAGQQIGLSVADGIALDRLDEKLGVGPEALNKKISALPVFSRACLEIWANGFWYGGNSTTKKEGKGNDLESWIAQLK